ncbi:MAG TPA: glycosyltransferase family 39 protein, partial [Terriglobales bacterium]|nr:glycosyltransferase family 39 protein [Terriglobales bacterium]
GAATAAASRLPNALLAAAMLVGLALFLRRVHSARAAWLALFLGLTSAFVFGFGRAATTDMTLTAPLALALMALYLWLREDRPAWLNWAAAALAFATLAKGPVAVVLVALTLIGFCATQRQWQWLRKLWRPSAIAIYFAIAAPWFIAVQWANPQFVREFFLQQNLERFASNRFAHPQPLWYYLPVLLLAVFPWTGWLGLPLQQAIHRLRARGWRRAWDGRDAPLHFWLLLWMLAPVVFFSLSQSKLPGYILPAIPAAIALIAVAAAERWEKLPHWPLLISAVLAGLLPVGVRWAPWFLAPRGQRVPATMLLHDTGGLLLAALAVFLLLYLVHRRRPVVLIAATCLIVAAAVFELSHAPLGHAVDVSLSGQALGRQVEAQCSEGLPQTCGDVPLYIGNLNRALAYGAQFELRAELTPWPESTLPPRAMVVMDKSAVNAFLARYGAAFDMARLSRFDPPPPAAAPWVVVRLRRR